MINWTAKLQSLVKAGESVILVTVVAVRGSAPREVGAKILVSMTDQWETIGGGNLEYQAIAHARNMLSVTGVEEALGDVPSVRSYALGPTLGQCCGGQVELMFERVDSDTGWLRKVAETARPAAGGRRWLCRSLTDANYHFIEASRSDPVNESEAVLLRNASCEPSTPDAPYLLAGTATDKGNSSAGWWCEVLDPALPQVWVFGAGHVGAAVHEQLQLLPCRTTAIDCRDDLLDNLPACVTMIASDDCAAEVAVAPANAWFLVMTHSHTLDFDICHAVLKRGDFSYLGLIGSATKRATFARRLAQRGIDRAQINRMISPIGLSSIRSRLPQLIALGVAADLAQRWQGAAS